MPALVLAQLSEGDVEVVLVAERLRIELTPDGREIRRFEPARQIRVDEEVYYTVRVRNTTDRPLYPVVVTRPVPENTTYVPGSAVAPAATVTFSVDDGRTFAEPNALTVTSSEGQVRSAVPGDYTHIRWQFGYPLAAGATAIARFRVILE
ncbi:MAG TPA: hypothetical protein VLT59_02890 [Steroidobacteraceae bacterium]|nr:hypothetical protein [Steroidobacteraceae bacterium]